MSYDKVINLGRGMIAFGGSKQGALMQVDGKNVYYRNSKGSVLYKLVNPTELGEGCCYAGSAPTTTKSMVVRGEKIKFEWVEGNTTRQVLISNEEGFKDIAEARLKEWYEPNQPNLVVPLEVFKKMGDMLSTKLTLEGNTLTVYQAQSNGDVEIYDIIKLLAGSKEKKEVTFFTSDLGILKDFVTSLKIGIYNDKPMSVYAKTSWGAEIFGLVAHQRYETGPAIDEELAYQAQIDNAEANTLHSEESEE